VKKRLIGKPGTKVLRKAEKPVAGMPSHATAGKKGEKGRGGGKGEKENRRGNGAPKRGPWDQHPVPFCFRDSVPYERSQSPRVVGE